MGEGEAGARTFAVAVHAPYAVSLRIVGPGRCLTVNRPSDRGIKIQNVPADIVESYVNLVSDARVNEDLAHHGISLRMTPSPLLSSYFIHHRFAEPLDRKGERRQYVSPGPKTGSHVQHQDTDS